MTNVSKKYQLSYANCLTASYYSTKVCKPKCAKCTSGKLLDRIYTERNNHSAGYQHRDGKRRMETNVNETI